MAGCPGPGAGWSGFPGHHLSAGRGAGSRQGGVEQVGRQSENIKLLKIIMAGCN